MKNIFTSIMVLLFSLSLSAQMNTFTYDELLNDPNVIPNFEFYVDFLHMEYSQNNQFTLGFELGARGTIANKVKLGISYNRPYSSNFMDWSLYRSYEAINQNLYHPSYSNIKLVQDFKLSNNFEVSAGFIISNKSYKKDKLIKLRTRGKVDFVSKINTNMRKRISVRAGYYHYRGSVDLLPDLKSDNYFLSTNGDQFYSDKVKYSDVDYSTLQNANNRDYSYLFTDNPLKGWMTNVDVNSIFIGFEIEYISNLVISTDKFGIRTNQQINKLYGDIFYGKPVIDDFLFFKSNSSAVVYGQEIGTEIISYTPKTGQNENEINTSNFGFRIGLESDLISPTKFINSKKDNPATKVFNLGAKIEFGYLPGVKSNFFGKLGIILYFNKM